MGIGYGGGGLNQLERLGISHHFGGGVYAKETRIPADMRLQQHEHSHDHLSILASGTVEVTVSGVTQRYTAPACLTIAAGKAHEVVSITDAVWFCVWETKETDPDKIDALVIA